MDEFRRTISNISMIQMIMFRIVLFTFVMGFMFVSAESNKTTSSSGYNSYYEQVESFDHYLLNVRSLSRESEQSGPKYQHHWPDIRFGWRIIVGSVVGFFGAACGSVGGVGGGGIYVPMLTIIIGFDAKSAVPISKCMITGAALSTVYYNLKRRHPTLDMPVIDYHLTLLMQPILMLGISVGVILSEIFADWMVTILLIILFLAISMLSFLKGVETWKKETKFKKEEVKRCLESNGNGNEDNHQQSDQPRNSTQSEMKTMVPVLQNVYWKELGLLVFVWVAFLILQIFKNRRETCSTLYWVLSALQIPVSVGVTLYEAVGLYRGTKVIASLGTDRDTKWRVYQLLLYAFVGLFAGTVGGLLGLGGGFIMGPLFLQLGVPPQVSTVTATFAMIFSSSVSVVEYYLLKRFPVPYALCLFAVATLAALVGQHVVRKIISVLGRASIIIFILVFTIFTSAIFLGGIGIVKMTRNVKHHDYMGFEKLCR
ncbi:sulfite exporter TauE/SafE family protein 3-like isoform X1 [Papaver somniferum]|nr:sulfite exporter TauE/SafE family protein 3-like isoform X1 [Papaver somniferum]